jgi:hypothetical protein
MPTVSACLRLLHRLLLLGLAAAALALAAPLWAAEPAPRTDTAAREHQAHHRAAVRAGLRMWACSRHWRPRRCRWT